MAWVDKKFAKLIIEGVTYRVVAESNKQYSIENIETSVKFSIPKRELRLPPICIVKENFWSYQ